MHPLFETADRLSHEVIGAAIEVHRHKGPGLIESIYERCLMRIGIFNSAIGAGEEILGLIAQEINEIAKDSKKCFMSSVGISSIFFPFNFRLITE